MTTTSIQRCLACHSSFVRAPDCCREFSGWVYLVLGRYASWQWMLGTFIYNRSSCLEFLYTRHEYRTLSHINHLLIFCAFLGSDYSRASFPQLARTLLLIAMLCTYYLRAHKIATRRSLFVTAARLSLLD